MHKYIKLALVIVTVTFFLLFVKQEKPESYTNGVFHVETEKTILYWTPAFRRVDFYLGLGSDIFKDCPYSNCYATHDRNYLPVEDFDAILFHGPEYQKKDGVPNKRKPYQAYIFANLESPNYTPEHYLKEFKNFYNWTMSYRTDSDIVRPYGSFQKQKTEYQIPSIEDVKRRPKKIAWFVSCCKARSQREELVKKIQNLIPVDVYGKCGNFKCVPSQDEKCYQMLETQYKFYLSFENSICRDYVTEKLYNVLKRNLLPIVYGGANYTALTPPHSVINVLDFKSVPDLVKYLKFLDTHPDEYLKFFEWKKEYVIDRSEHKLLCRLCKKLNEPKSTKVYDDIFDWWTGTSVKKCFNDVINKIL